jgi:hypothetical protein
MICTIVSKNPDVTTHSQRDVLRDFYSCDDGIAKIGSTANLPFLSSGLPSVVKVYNP